MRRFQTSSQERGSTRGRLSTLALGLTLCIVFLTSGCATYTPYAVRHVPGTQPGQSYPALDPKPILEGRDFAVFRSSQDNLRLFVVPTSLNQLRAAMGVCFACPSSEQMDGD